MIQKKRQTDDFTILYGKIPPNDVKLEEALIGACLFEPSIWIEASGILKKSHYFYSEHSMEIWNTMLVIDRQGGINTAMTVTAELRKRGTLEKVGGVYYINQLVVNASTQSEPYQKICLIIMEMWAKREMIRISGKGVEFGYDDQSDFNDSIKKVVSEYERIQLELKKISHVPFEKKVHKFLEWIESGESHDKSISWGYTELDELTMGPQRGTMSFIGARPATGKTSFLISALFNQSKKTKVGVWNGELSDIRFVLRMACNRGGITAKEVKQAYESKDKNIINKIEEAAKLLISNSNIYVDETRGMYVEDLVVLFRTWVRLYGVTIIWLDYINLLRSRQYRKFNNREQEMFTILDVLQTACKEDNYALIALSQLNRETLKNAEGKPTLHNIKEAGRVEEMAAFIAFLYRPELHEVTSDANGLTKNRVDVLVRKFSDGESNIDVCLAHNLQHFQIFDNPNKTFTPPPNFSSPPPKIDLPGSNNPPLDILPF